MYFWIVQGLWSMLVVIGGHQVNINGCHWWKLVGFGQILEALKPFWLFSLNNVLIPGFRAPLGVIVYLVWLIKGELSTNIGDGYWLLWRFNN